MDQMQTAATAESYPKWVDQYNQTKKKSRNLCNRSRIIRSRIKFQIDLKWIGTGSGSQKSSIIQTTHVKTHSKKHIFTVCDWRELKSD